MHRDSSANVIKLRISFSLEKLLTLWCEHVNIMNIWPLNIEIFTPDFSHEN